MKPMIKLIASLTLLTAANTSLAQKDDLNFATTKVSPNIYMLSGVGGFTGGNMALLTGADGVVLIDDSMPPMLDKLNMAIAKITQKKPVDFLINTHMHGDHIGNNSAMKALGAHIIGHENMRQSILNDNNEKTGENDLPIMTVSKDMSFHLNGEQARAIHAHKAHTDGDLFIHFKNANIIHTGDIMFNGMFPYIDLKNGGSINGYIAAQRKIIKLADKNTKIIPGHGPLADIEDLKASFTMLNETKAIVEDLIKTGKTEDEVVALNPLQGYHDAWNWGFITTEKMTRQLYQGLTSAPMHAHKGGKEHSH